MQNNYSQREIRKTIMENNNQSYSEKSDNYSKSNLKSTTSNENQAGKSLKKRSKAKDGEENENNENLDDLLYDNPILRSTENY